MRKGFRAAPPRRPFLGSHASGVLRTDGLVPGIARFQRAPDRWPCSWDRTLPACSGLMALFLGSHASSVLRIDGPVPGIARFQRAPDALANKKWSFAGRFPNPIDRSPRTG